MKLLKPAYTLFVKTGPSCNAGCNSCPSGRKQPGDIESIPMMRLEMFQRILDRALSQGDVISVVLHYLNEPTINPHMPDIIAYGVKRGVYTSMSTNGSFPENLYRCIDAGLDQLIMSVSGFTQAVHERSHKNTDIEKVKAAMREVSRRRKKGQFVRVGWHDYTYNRHEQAQMRALARELGFKFDAYQTSLLPLEAALDRLAQVRDDPNSPEHPGERDLMMKLTEAKQWCDDRRHFTCIIQQRMFSVDGNGYLYNCCAKGNAPGNRRESIFDVNLEDVNQKRFSDPDCAACKAVGGHAYGTQKHQTPLTVAWDVRRWAEDRWRDLGLGRHRRLIKWAAKLYHRPNRKDSKA